LTANRLLCGKRFVKSKPAIPDKVVTCRVCLRYISRLIPANQ
jgi:hypothetical protein